MKRLALPATWEELQRYPDSYVDSHWGGAYYEWFTDLRIVADWLILRMQLPLDVTLCVLDLLRCADSIVLQDWGKEASLALVVPAETTPPPQLRYVSPGRGIIHPQSVYATEAVPFRKQ